MQFSLVNVNPELCPVKERSRLLWQVGHFVCRL